MGNKEIVLEDMIEFIKPVITTINLITESNFKDNESTKNMVKSTLIYLERHLKVSELNKNCLKNAIEFNLFHSLFIGNQDNKFTFREKTNLIFETLKMKDSDIYNIIDSIYK